MGGHEHCSLPAKGAGQQQAFACVSREGPPRCCERDSGFEPVCFRPSHWHGEGRRRGPRTHTRTHPHPHCFHWPKHKQTKPDIIRIQLLPFLGSLSCHPLSLFHLLLSQEVHVKQIIDQQSRKGALAQLNLEIPIPEITHGVKLFKVRSCFLLVSCSCHLFVFSFCFPFLHSSHTKPLSSPHFLSFLSLSLSLPPSLPPLSLSLSFTLSLRPPSLPLFVPCFPKQIGTSCPRLQASKKIHQTIL